MKNIRLRIKVFLGAHVVPKEDESDKYSLKSIRMSIIDRIYDPVWEVTRSQNHASADLPFKRDVAQAIKDRMERTA